MRRGGLFWMLDLAPAPYSAATKRTQSQKYNDTKNRAGQDSTVKGETSITAKPKETQDVSKCKLSFD